MRIEFFSMTLDFWTFVAVFLLFFLLSLLFWLAKRFVDKITRTKTASEWHVTSIYHTEMPDCDDEAVKQLNLNELGGEKMSGKINWNDVAKKVTLKEKGKEQISIAQVKEVLKVTAKILVKDYPDYEILMGLNHLANR